MLLQALKPLAAMRMTGEKPADSAWLPEAADCGPDREEGRAQASPERCNGDHGWRTCAAVMGGHRIAPAPARPK